MPDIEPGPDDTELVEQRQRRLWDLGARVYDLVMAPLEHHPLGAVRAELLSHAQGRTVEVGIGTGINLRHYPSQVALLGVDASPAMLGRARTRAVDLQLPAELVEGSAEALDLPDESVDTVVATLLLCSVLNVADTLVEFRRVLKPDGLLLLLDHVESSNPVMRGVQAVADQFTIVVGERWRRRPLLELEAAGFRLLRSYRGRGRVFEAVVAQKG